MHDIEQFVKERREIKPLRTCESYFFTLKKKRCISYKICFTKNRPSRYEVLPGHQRFALLSGSLTVLVSATT